MTEIAISIKSLSKTYSNGFQALKNVDLEVKKGEIFALLGPNGAGKTTLIGAVCGSVRPTSGKIEIFGYDHSAQFRQARSHIGLVPQELYTEAFETVWQTIRYSRELFGKRPNDAFVEEVVRSLSLWDKKDNQIRTLSGGMKRRLMIAKALAHEPTVLFLDEPSAGVDVELRKSMWEQVERLRQQGMTIFLTTHYIEEAEKMADKIGVINDGKIILVEEKETLMKKMSNKQLIVKFDDPVKKLPDSLLQLQSDISIDGNKIVYTYDTSCAEDNIIKFLEALRSSGLKPKDLNITKRNLEDIFVELVEKK